MYVEVGGACLWVEDEGSGPAILFLHGGLGDSRLWSPVAERLHDAFRCVRYDLRFFGKSKGPAEEWSSIDDAVAVLDALDIDRAALVGLSMGGALALDVALAHPERVTAVVHVAGAVSGSQLELDPELEARYEAAEGDREAELAVDLDVWAPLGAERAYRELWQATPAELPDGARPVPRPEVHLDRIAAPIFVVIATHDPPQLQELARQIPAARRVEMDSDHYLTLREPDSVAALIREFLAGPGLFAAQIPGVAGSSVQGIVPRRLAAISLRSAGSQTRTVSAWASATSALIAAGLGATK